MWVDFLVCNYYVHGVDFNQYRVKGRDIYGEFHYLTEDLEMSTCITKDFRGTKEDCEEFIALAKGDVSDNTDWNDHE